MSCAFVDVLWLQMVSNYWDHLTELTTRGQRAAMFNVYSLLGQDKCFAIPGNQKPERRKKTSKGSRKSLSKLSTRKETTL